MTMKFDKTVARIIKNGEIGSVLAVDLKAVNPTFADFRDRAPTWREQRHFSGNNIMTMGIFYEAATQPPIMSTVHS